MSFHAPEMDRDYSAQSLSSRGGSELGSRYMVESGFYMTSFAATVFIGGLIVVGVLLITLLIALTVMLQSCESKSSGVVEIPPDDHSYCLVYGLHAELNSLEVDSFPSVCRGFIARYIKQGQYSRDLNFTLRIAEDYLMTIMPLNDVLDVVVMDMDDIFVPNSSYGSLLFHWHSRFGCKKFDEEANRLRCTLLLKLYSKLRVGGWPLILLSRKPEKLRNVTTDYLLSAGYGGWSSLIMRSDEELQMDNYEYFSRRREKLHEQGYRIRAIISTQMDALTGPFSAKRIFKLPNPIYCSPEHRSSEITDLLQ